MTVFSPQTLALLWERNGGNPAAAVSAVAVALAESGGDQFAVSPAFDYGLWQINIANFPAQGLTVNNWWDPDLNARVAVRMSGNGSNWAAWCTAWADPSNCGHGYVPVPQPGSPAGNQLARAAAALGTVAGPTATANPNTNVDRFTEAWGDVQLFHSTFAPAINAQLSGYNQLLRRY